MKIHSGSTLQHRPVNIHKVRFFLFSNILTLQLHYYYTRLTASFIGQPA